MWIFANDCFVSIVEDRDMHDQVWVRGRVSGDVERFVEDDLVPVIETNEADYRFRACIDKQRAAELVMGRVGSVSYENFKGSIPETEEGDRRHQAYIEVWSAMNRYQRNEATLEELRGHRPKRKRKAN